MSQQSAPSKLETLLQSRDFALYLSIAIMLTQSIHSSHALYDLTALPYLWMKVVFAVTTAVCMDFLMIYFVAHRAIQTSYFFFAFSAVMNVYAYHIDMAFFRSFDSFFVFIPAFAIPYGVHAVATLRYTEKEEKPVPREVPEMKNGVSQEKLVFGSDRVQW